MRIVSIFLFLFALSVVNAPAEEVIHTSEDDFGAGDELFRAVREGDIATLQMVSPEALECIIERDGRTLLMEAAAAGQFKATRYLLWRGVDAMAEDGKGVTARDYLSRGDAGFAPLNLLIRCYEFVSEHSEPAGKASRPELVLINDDYVDYTHPLLRERYYVNEKERTGEAGVDDDGNGFVDDSHGWNLANDEALRAPLAGLLSNWEDRESLEKLYEQYRAACELLDYDELEAGEIPDHPIASSYTNPVAQDTGSVLLQLVGADMNDYRFCRMIEKASHGSHVAGIVNEFSDGKALLHGVTWYPFHITDEEKWNEWGFLRDLAETTDSYAEFLSALRNRILEDAVVSGKRMSAYLKETGAGVINMSWSEDRTFYRNLARRAQEVYSYYGDASSMEEYICPNGFDLCGNLAIELAAADVAMFALVIDENPDVLFVMSAGNKGQNNDVEMNTPSYLSRFFPNAMAVAWLYDEYTLSHDSNYGVRSVQIAAPGEEVLSCLVGGLRGRMSGTSMAAPAVAGVAAQIRHDFPEVPAADIRRILERSARPVSSLEDLVETGAALDRTAAFALAAEWNSEGVELSDEELFRLSSESPGPKGPVVTGRRTRLETEYWETLSEGGEDASRIRAIGGYQNRWQVVMEKGLPFARQLHVGVDLDPWGLISEKWDEGFRVTSLAGDEGTGWGVVMSTGVPGAQEIIDYEWEQIRELRLDGYRITQIAGWRGDWRLVLSTQTGIGDQRICLPTAFDDLRREWIDDHLRNGYRITDICGDDDWGNGESHWVVVMSKGTDLGPQIHTGPGEWPAQWIAEQQANGYVVSTCAGYEGKWVVVMTESDQATEQAISPPGSWPTGFVMEHWEGAE